MFRKVLSTLALVAVLFTTFTPAHAATLEPAATQTLTGRITYFGGSKYLAVQVLPSSLPMRVYVNQETQICLQGKLIDFNQLRLGDTVKVTLQSTKTPGYLAQFIEVSRKGSIGYLSLQVNSSVCDLMD